MGAPMANEILYTGIGDLRLTEFLAAAIELTLADRYWLWGHPALVFRGDIAGQGSSTVKVPQVGLGGADEMAAVAENAAVAVTNLTDASDTLAVARQSLARKMSDLARITDPSGGVVNVTALAGDLVMSAMGRFTTMLAALGGGFTSTVGSTGVNLSVDNWFTGVLTLELANVPGPYISTLHSQQIGDLRTSLRSESNIPLQDRSVETVQRVGQASAGALLGVDILRVNRTPTANAGADRAGMMWARGGIHWADASVPGIPGVPAALGGGGRISVKMDTEILAANTILVGDYYVAVGIMDTAAGINVTTDA